MKIEYWHTKKKEHRLMQTDDIEIDLENGYRLYVDATKDTVKISVLSKNDGKKLFYKTADEFVSELKGE